MLSSVEVEVVMFRRSIMYISPAIAAYTVEITKASTRYFIRLIPMAWAAEVLFFTDSRARPIGLRIRLEVMNSSRTNSARISRYTCSSPIFTPKSRTLDISSLIEDFREMKVLRRISERPSVRIAR